MNTVQDLRQMLRTSEDEEPLSIILERPSGERLNLALDGVSSAAGGRASILWLKEAWTKESKPDPGAGI